MKFGTGTSTIVLAFLLAGCSGGTPFAGNAPLTSNDDASRPAPSEKPGGDETDSSTLKSAEPPVLIAGANLAVLCSTRDSEPRNLLSDLTCFFSQTDLTPLTPGSVTVVEAAIVDAAGNTLASPTYTANQATNNAKVRGIPLSNYVGGIVLRLKLLFNGKTETADIALAPFAAQAALLDQVSPPAPAPAPAASLYGQWVGFCGHGSTSSTCNQKSVAPAVSVNNCATGFDYHHVAARWQGTGDNSGQTDRYTGTCLRKKPSDPSIVAAMDANPAEYAQQDGFYGLCAYKYNSSTCNKKLVPPMRNDKSCPAGFAFKQISAQFAFPGDPDYSINRLGTCVALVTGANAEPAPQSSYAGLCVYDYNSSNPGGSCKHAQEGRATVRGQCDTGYSFFPIAARWDGINEQWVGVCLKD
jgi:hypothetical protein